MFDREEALQYIFDFMKRKNTFVIEDFALKEAVEAALKADIAYMIRQGLLKEVEGDLQATENGFYDDDEAFEYILGILKTQKENIKVKAVSEFVDEYMDAAESFLEESDLLGWDD